MAFFQSRPLGRFLSRSSHDAPPLNGIDDTEVLAFIVQARDRGLGDLQSVRLLRQSGWAGEDIDWAFFKVNQQAVGRVVPTPSIYRDELKTVLLCGVSFAALGIWAQAIGQAAFGFIDYAFVGGKAGSSAYGPALYAEAIASLARFMVFYPVYLWSLSALRLSDRAQLPGVKKGLAYVTLMVIGLSALYTLTQFLSLVLQGGVTAAFLLKSAVLLVICADIFRYYFRQTL